MNFEARLKVSRFLLPALCAAALHCAAPFEGRAQELPVVAVARIERSDLFREVAFDAELQPFQEVELHARVTGYLDAMKVDAGDSVKEGDVLAILDAPESKIEIEHALANERGTKAEIDRAEASYEEAHSAYERLFKTSEAQPNLIARQDLDAAKARDRAAAAALDAARARASVASAEVKKLRTMLDYTRITAPFTGVITKRYSDPGALIQAGTSSGTLPLVRLSQLDKLRAVFPISISYVASIKVGDPVEFRIASLKRTISGKVSRFSRKVESATRTMEAEVDLPNDDLTLIPGIYATALLKTDRREKTLVAPVEAVVREKEGGSVFVITGDGVIEERKVTVGVETPAKLELLTGVQEGELVMIGSRAQVFPGQMVEAKIAEPQPAKGAH